MKMRTKTESRKIVTEKDGYGSTKKFNNNNPSSKSNKNTNNDFDTAVREEMNRLEQKLQTMTAAAEKPNHAYNNAYNNGQHKVPKSELQIGFGTDPITEKALKKAKQVEYKRQLDDAGSSKKSSAASKRNSGETSSKKHTVGASPRNVANKSLHTEPPSVLSRGRRPSVEGNFLGTGNINNYNSGNSYNDLQGSNGYNKSYTDHFSPLNKSPLRERFDEFHSPTEKKGLYGDGGGGGMQMKSPSQARLRLVSDMYGASSVIGDSGTSPGKWRPSGGNDDYEKKRNAAMENKRGLDEQIAQDKKRKDDEKARERQSDDKAMEKMLRQHEDDREREKNARDALKKAIRNDEKRHNANNGKNIQLFIVLFNTISDIHFIFLFT